MIVRPGIATDLGIVTAWLEAAGLPSADLTEAHMDGFLVAVIHDTAVGMIGLEAFGAVGLLRSLVVDPGAQRGGIGRRLVAALEANAVAKGVGELWLLTIDADAYFAPLGYEAMARETAPDSIRSTPEFADLCPGDAILMRKAIG